MAAAIAGAGLRLGSLVSKLKNLRNASPVLQTVIPSSKAGLAFELGPDLLFAGMAPFMLPESATPLERGLGFVEEAALGLGGSIGGRALGATGRRLAGGRTREQLENAANMGGFAGGFASSMFGPRPITRAVWEREQQRQAEDMERQVLARHGIGPEPASRDSVSMEPFEHRDLGAGLSPFDEYESALYRLAMESSY